jgi:hypothetical protein
MPNIGGPGYNRRILLSRVVSSVLLYAAPIWATAITIKETRRKLRSVYRLSALRTIRGYRTVSDDAACVIADMMPIDIIADEMLRINRRRAAAQGDRQALKRIKEEERTASMTTWQNRWDTSPKGRWTHRLIGCIETWRNRKHGNCGYQLTQFLSGHGGYRKYLHRFGHDNSPRCPECPEEDEDVEHCIFRCPRFNQHRVSLPSPELLVAEMIQSEQVWGDICTLVSVVQIELRRIERERLAEAASIEDAA